MKFFKNTFPLGITFLAGMILIIAYFIPHPVAEAFGTETIKWALIIFAFAMTLGILNLFVINFKKVYKKSSGWGYSVVLLTGLVATVFIGIYPGFGGIAKGTPFNYIFRYFYTPLSATMFSLLAFFVASAAFRAFRAKTFEASILLIAAVIVMLGRVPLGDLFINYLSKFLDMINLSVIANLVSKINFSGMAEWIMIIPNTAGQRAILIGAALGAIAISVKILLGIERTYLGKEE